MRSGKLGFEGRLDVKVRRGRPSLMQRIVDWLGYMQRKVTK